MAHGANRHGRNSAMANGQPLQLYAIGIGSNRAISLPLGPRAIVHAAMVALDLPPFHVLARSPVIDTAPIGPSLRRYANAAALVASPLPPRAMLARLQALEAAFGRRRFRRWGARTLDLDILLWSGGPLRTRGLVIPHPAMHERAFVLRPLCAILPNWRDPVTGLAVRHLAARLARAKAKLG
jgi:2-amino-4-hydroxy-6-hydroxymethyldihydropteridine diphosphokinase